MKLYNKKDNYSKTVQIEYKGCFYHSILELKFVLLIEDKCSWIREPVAIHYNPLTLKATNYISENTKKYIPDFLVRKWKENTGHLIEIKPKFLIETEKVKIKKQVAEDYINNKNVDWIYSIITEEDIILSKEKQKKLEELISNNKNFKSKLDLIKRDRRFNNKTQKYHRSIPFLNSNEITIEDYRRYVKYGVMPSAEGEDNLLLEQPIEYESLTEKEKHLKFLKLNYHINCSRTIFSAEEIEVLEKYGSWLEALYLKKIKPITIKQKAFLKELESNKLPENKFAKVWFKYIKRIEIEHKFGDSLKSQYVIDNQDFYKREDYYKLHKDKIRRI
jgi:uncharacterized protein